MAKTKKQIKTKQKKTTSLPLFSEPPVSRTDRQLPWDIHASTLQSETNRQCGCYDTVKILQSLIMNCYCWWHMKSLAQRSVDLTKKGNTGKCVGIELAYIWIEFTCVLAKKQNKTTQFYGEYFCQKVNQIPKYYIIWQIF